MRKRRWNSSLARGRRVIGIELRVARNKQIEIAIVIIVAPCSAGRPSPEGYTSSFRNVGKRAVAIVMIETILAEVRYVYVRPAIVIEVSDRHAEAPSFIGHASFFCNVGECSVMVVVQQHGAWRGFLAFQGWER